MLHEKLDSLCRLMLQRDYDMQGQLDKQVWSFDECMLKCEEDTHRVELVNADRMFEQQFHHDSTSSQFHLSRAGSLMAERLIRQQKQARTMLRLCMVKRVIGRYELLRAS